MTLVPCLVEAPGTESGTNPHRPRSTAISGCRWVGLIPVCMGLMGVHLRLVANTDSQCGWSEPFEWGTSGACAGNRSS